MQVDGCRFSRADGGDWATGEIAREVLKGATGGRGLADTGRRSAAYHAGSGAFEEGGLEPGARPVRAGGLTVAERGRRTGAQKQSLTVTLCNELHS